MCGMGVWDGSGEETLGAVSFLTEVDRGTEWQAARKTKQ